jgi:hypothetical protein
MSGIFSIASHWALQYLPEDVTQVQMGCAHFSAFAVSIIFSPGFGSGPDDPCRNRSRRGKGLLCRKAQNAKRRPDSVGTPFCCSPSAAADGEFLLVLKNLQQSL